MKTVKIRLDGLGGMPMDEKTLKSTYATLSRTSAA